MIKAHVGLFRVGRCRAFSLLLKEVETDADAVGIPSRNRSVLRRVLTESGVVIDGGILVAYFALLV